MPDEDGQPPEGTRIFSARELSDIKTKPAIDPEELARSRTGCWSVLSQAARVAARAPARCPSCSRWSLNLLFEAVPRERGAILLLRGHAPEPDGEGLAQPRRAAASRSVSRSIARRVLERRESMLLPNLMEDAAFSPQDSHPVHRASAPRYARRCGSPPPPRSRTRSSASSTSTPWP